jgi:DNA/RNA endonuclease YhcR with UshA esterase domain
MSHMNHLIVAAQTRFGDLRARAEAESEQGDIVEKVIVTAAVAAISIAAMAAISLLVTGKIAGIKL